MILIHFGIVAWLISLRDIKSHRIKRRDIWISTLTLLPLIEISSLIFGILNFLLYLGIYLISNKSLGYGDVRLAGLIGLYLGGLESSFIDVAKMNSLCWGIAGLWVLVRSIEQREVLRDRIAFAPFMFAGFASWFMFSESEGISAILG
jgi:prepilin signal peptidase PulO-like enzyme (type II secretory pathway)